jgi:ATP-dependent DNA helicase RecG
MASITLESRLTAVAGTKAKKLQEGLGIETVGELLAHYPRTLIQRGQTSDAGEFVAGEHQTVIAEVVTSEQFPYKDRRTGRMAYRLQVVAQVGESRVVMTFFDQNKGRSEWRQAKLHKGVSVMFAGKAGWNARSRMWELVHPTYDEVDESSVEETLSHLSELRPIYPATKNVTSWELERVIAVALDMLDDEIPDLLPDEIRSDRGLLSRRRALELIHRPPDWAAYGAALKRLKFDEALVTQTVLAQRRLVLQRAAALARPGRPDGLLAAFDARLPFQLTTGQEQVCEEVMADLARTHPMHRLLQGEVGSGKTVVALRAMLQVVDSGGQAVLLAPTEVLAQQHYRSIPAMLGDLAGAGMLGGADQATRVALMTGSLGAQARRAALLDAASGAAGIVIGTHALLEDTVQFADLGLLVVDEQHRFGVEQRAALAERPGPQPHVLVMTATPIPRTIAMTVFGDLETSSLTELPAGRSPIQTNVVPLAEQPAWIDRVWTRVREEVEKGHQVYVVCPRISSSQSDEDSGTEVGRSVAGVEAVAEEVTAGPLSGLRVSPLHGRMAADAKDATMRAFAAGDIDVLVATTVIEVGVDVANATAMVILDADSFGVSQLHQLRGRVGRGGHHGLCLLVTKAEAMTRARERLDAVAGTLDGFELSQIDLEQRREGDVLGTSQSGGRGALKLLSVVRDESVISQARDLAIEIVSRDADLLAHPELARAVNELQDSPLSDYLDKT